MNCPTWTSPGMPGSEDTLAGRPPGGLSIGCAVAVTGCFGPTSCPAPDSA